MIDIDYKHVSNLNKIANSFPYLNKNVSECFIFEKQLSQKEIIEIENKFLAKEV